MKNNKPMQKTHVSAKACADCHFAAKIKNRHQVTAHCIMLDLPIYRDEYYDSNSCLRDACRNSGDFFISSLSNISRIELFEWKMLHHSNVLSRQEKHISTIVIVVKVVLALLMVIATFLVS